MSQSSPLESLYQEDLYRISGKVILIFSKPWEEILEDEKKLLSKILVAVKLTTASVQIITRGEFALEDLKEYNPTYILAFGATLKNPFKKYEPISIGGTSLLLADQLDDLKKRNLWVALKQMFQS
jgi:hypothetical protein